MKFKKIISLALTMLMMVSVIPFSVSATTDWGVGDTLEDALSELKVFGEENPRLEWLSLKGLTNSVGTEVILQRYTYFLYDDGSGETEPHPVYCIDPSRGGAYELVHNPMGINVRSRLLTIPTRLLLLWPLPPTQLPSRKWGQGRAKR